ncbi:MAG: phage shock protein A [Gammaproteobacteria bacterium]|jgi:phage shock protein A
MALINRFSRLFTADLHAVMDRMEEPETILKQAVREMEDELSKMRAQTQAWQIESERYATQEKELGQQLADLNEELDVCFDSAEEALAKKVIRSKLETEKRRQTVGSQSVATRKSFESQELEIAENQRHLDGVQQKLEIVANKFARAAVFDIGLGEVSVAAEDVEIAYLREKQRRSK